MPKERLLIDDILKYHGMFMKGVDDTKDMSHWIYQAMLVGTTIGLKNSSPNTNILGEAIEDIIQSARNKNEN